MNDATITAIFATLAAGIVCQAQEKAEAEVPSDKEAGHHAPVTTGHPCKPQITNMRLTSERLGRSPWISPAMEHLVLPLSRRLQTGIAYGDKRRA